MKFQPVIFSLILLAFLTSCLDLQKENQLNDLNVLTERVDSIQVALESQNIENLDEITREIDQINNRLLSLGDTISVELAIQIDRFKNTAQLIEPFLSIQQYLDTNCNLSKSSISHLKLDIEKANGKRKLYVDHVKFEKSKVDSLRMYLDSLILLKTGLTDGFENDFPILNDQLSIRAAQLGTNLDNNK